MNSILWPNPAFANNITVFGPEVKSLAGRYLRQMLEDIWALPIRRSRRFAVGQHRVIIPHQANKTMVIELAAAAGITADQLYFNIEQVGNASSASIPLAIDDAVRDGVITKPTRVSPRDSALARSPATRFCGSIPPSSHPTIRPRRPAKKNELVPTQSGNDAALATRPSRRRTAGLLAARIPDARLVTIQAGHDLQKPGPAAVVAQLVGQFLDVRTRWRANSPVRIQPKASAASLPDCVGTDSGTASSRVGAA